MQFDKKLIRQYWKYSIGIPLIAGGFLLFKPTEKKEIDVTQIEGAVLVPEDQSQNADPTKAALPGVAPGELSTEAQTPSLPATAVAERVNPISKEEQRQFRQELDRYIDLQEIALKTAHEKERLKEWYRDPDMIRSVRDFLSGTPENLDEGTLKMHQEATEFLIEAVKDQSEVAVEAVLDVLKNPNLENPAVAKEVRQVMAESQAELLYETVPNVPAIADFVRSQASPTQKAIYKNIHEIYQQNLKESQAELARK